MKKMETNGHQSSISREESPAETVKRVRQLPVASHICVLLKPTQNSVARIPFVKAIERETFGPAVC